jgi:hypothetical protein
MHVARPSHRPTRRRSWLFALIALVATTAQLAVALAPLAEGREDRATVHIESGGAQRHVQHNDATCAACQARNIHGTAPRSAAPEFESSAHQSVVVATIDRIDAADVRSATNPRAPPSVI